MNWSFMGCTKPNYSKFEKGNIKYDILMAYDQIFTKLLNIYFITSVHIPGNNITKN